MESIQPQHNPSSQGKATLGSEGTAGADNWYGGGLIEPAEQGHGGQTEGGRPGGDIGGEGSSNREDTDRAIGRAAQGHEQRAGEHKGIAVGGGGGEWERIQENKEQLTQSSNREEEVQVHAREPEGAHSVTVKSANDKSSKRQIFKVLYFNSRSLVNKIELLRS